jgi:hypothetical protein
MEEQPNGFELGGVFYPWNVTTRGMDLILIDRISGMTPQDFFALVEDNHDLTRAPVMLSLIATSIRNRHPDWSLERIIRAVMALDLDDVEIIGGDEDEAEADAESPPSEGDATGLSGSSPQTSNGSAVTTSETSPETPDSSGSPGSHRGSPITAETT